MTKCNLVFGVGINDSGKFKSHIGKKKTKEYQAWQNMLARCYSESYQKKNATYKDCYVCDGWLKFQAFAEWYNENYPKNKERYQIDKDLKFLGNKIYSPDTCVFVSQKINKFTTNMKSRRGEFMIGVNFDKSRGLFLSKCNNPITGKIENLGRFKSQYDAHMAWRKRKSQLCVEISNLSETIEIEKVVLLGFKSKLDSFEIYKDGFNL